MGSIDISLAVACKITVAFLFMLPVSYFLVFVIVFAILALVSKLSM